MGSDGGGDVRPPLWIHPLSCHKLEESDNCKSDQDGSYQVIQRLLSPNPRLPDSEIETVLEAYETPLGCLWRRVSVWSGLTTKRLMQASFILPNQSGLDSVTKHVSHQAAHQAARHEQASLLCWAAFPERPNHKLLCVLVNPAMLTIWDVYPSADDNNSDGVYISAEGHSVSLPFSCSSIHPLGKSQGIFLERKQEQEDLDARKVSEHQNMDIQNGELEDEFFLKVPPRNTRLASVQTDHNDAGQNLFPHPQGGAPLATPRTAYTALPVEVASLFSLTHPLEDVLPVALSSQDNMRDGAIITDVFEKIIHSSTLRWVDQDDHQEYHHPICITYNTMLKR